MQTCARGCKCIAQHIKETFLWGTIKCPEMGKQNLQAKKVYSVRVENVCKCLQKNVLSCPISPVMHLKLIQNCSQTTARARVQVVNEGQIDGRSLALGLFSQTQFCLFLPLLLK